MIAKITIFAKDMRRPGVRDVRIIRARPGRCCVRCRWVKFVFMITLDTIRKPVTAELEAFDEFVDRQFTAEGELLADMLRYALSSRGKAYARCW